jgi:hypothetical protein
MDLRRPQRLKIPLLTISVLFVSAIAAYALYVQHRRTYLTDWNFRRLSAMTERIDAQLATCRQAVDTVVHNPHQTLASLYRACPFERDASMLRELNVPLGGTTKIENRFEDGLHWFYFRYDEGNTHLHVRVRAERLVAPALESDGFDKLFLASADGRVLFQQGRSGVDLTTLAGILKDEKGKEANVSQLGRSSRLLDVEVAGESYKMFLQPCATPLLEGLRSGAVQGGWILGGLVESGRLTTRTLRVSPMWIVVLFAFLLLLALAWPFLRLIVMSSGERLRAVDGLLISLCALVGLSTLVILLLDGLVYFRLTRLARGQVEGLAAEVRDSVRNDLDAALERLRRLHGLALGEVKAAAEVIPLTPSSGDPHSCMLPAGSASLNFFWIDAKGQQLFDWAVAERAVPRGSLRALPAFQNLVEPRLWVRQVHGNVFHYSAAPIRATKGESLIVITIPVAGGISPAEPATPGKPLGQVMQASYRPAGQPRSFAPSCPQTELLAQAKEQASIAGLTTRMPSFDRLILPPGLGFAVINEEGRVLFHSNSQKNLQENFLQEADSSRLRSLLFAQRSDHVKIFYEGRQYQAYPVHIPGLPWSVVAFRDLSLMGIVNVQILSIALLCLFAYALAFLLLFSVFYLLPAFRARWVWPSQALKGTYVQLTAFYLCCLILYASSLLVGTPALLFWTGMLMPLLVVFVTYIKIHLDRAEGRIQELQTRHWITLLLAVLVMVVLLAASLPRLTREEAVFVVLSLAAGVGLLFFPSVTELLKRQPSVLRHQDAYLIAGTLLFVILAIPPAASFFKLSCDIPAENLVKYGQLHFLRALAEEGRIDEMTEAVDVQRAGGFFQTQLFVCSCGGGRCARHRAPESRLYDSEFLEKLELSLPAYNHSAAEMARLTADSVAGRGWRWEHLKGGELLLHGVTDATGRAWHVSSVLPKKLAFDGTRWAGAGLVVGLAGLILLIVGLMWFFARQLFLLNVDVPVWLERARKGCELKIKALGGNLIYVSRRGDLRDRIKVAKEIATLVIDLETMEKPIRNGSVLSSSQLKGQDVIVLDKFEHRLNDAAFNDAKLRLVESLTGDSDRRVIVLTKIDPYLCLVNSRFCGGAPAEESARSVRQRWMSLLGEFETFDLDSKGDATWLQQKLETFKKDHLRRETTPWPKRAWASRLEACVKLVHEECSVTGPLQEIGIELIDDLDPERMGREQILDEIRERAELYYQALWSSLTDSQKTILVQLAEEGLVNPKSRRPLQRLMARGLVERNPAPQLMNESFRSFVLSGKCRPHALEAERRSTAQGLWSYLKIPLTATFWTVAAFFYLTQREVFDSTLVFVSAATGALPHLLELVGYLGAARTNAAAAS